MKHRDELCVGQWDLEGDPQHLTAADAHIVCRACGAAYRYTITRHGEGVIENLCGVQALIMTREGRKLLEEERKHGKPKPKD